MKFLGNIKQKIQSNLTQKPLRVYGEVLGNEISIFILPSIKMIKEIIMLIQTEKKKRKKKD